MRIALALASLALGLAACGDNLGAGGPDPDAATADAATVDAAPRPVDAMLDANCPSRTLGQVGGPCTTASECDSAPAAADGFCLRPGDGPYSWPAEGFCTMKVGVCTADAQCGAGNICATINDPGGAFKTCMPACGTGDCGCANNQLCGDNFAGSPILQRVCLPGNRAAVDGDRCTGFGDCDEDSLCRVDRLEHPGGQCMQIGCTIGTDSTCTSGGDGHCVDPGFATAGTGCIDACTNDNDCRAGDGYKCVDEGGTIGRHCRHPRVGDACSVDTDCGRAADWDCRTGVTLPGGYCTIATACPTVGSTVGCTEGSSACAEGPLPVATDNFCVNRCRDAQIGTQGSCRSGYVCRDVDPGAPVVGGCINP